MLSCTTKTPTLTSSKGIRRRGVQLSALHTRLSCRLHIRIKPSTDTLEALLHYSTVMSRGWRARGDPIEADSALRFRSTKENRRRGSMAGYGRGLSCERPAGSMMGSAKRVWLCVMMMLKWSLCVTGHGCIWKVCLLEQ